MEKCGWLVRDSGPGPDAPWEAHEAFAERSAEAGPDGLVVECGEPVAPDGRHALCVFHEDAMALSDREFEALSEAHDGHAFS